MALFDPGDEVILFEPFYGYHATMLKARKAIPVPVACTAPDWNVDLGAVRAAITPKTRAMLINSPDWVEGMAAFKEKRDPKF